MLHICILYEWNSKGQRRCVPCMSLSSYVHYLLLTCSLSPQSCFETDMLISQLYVIYGCWTSKRRIAEESANNTRTVA
jgi:hypothetical protein